MSWIKLIKATDYDSWLDKQIEDYMDPPQWRGVQFSGGEDFDIEFESDYRGAELLKLLDPNVDYLYFSVPFYYNFSASEGAYESDIDFDSKNIKDYKDIAYKDENGPKITQDQFKQWYQKYFDDICYIMTDYILDYLNENYDRLSKDEPDYDDIGD